VKTQRELRFDGETYDATQDFKRLKSQLSRVFCALASEGKWWTLAELAHVAGGSEAGVSARLRDLRKQRFGAHSIERKRHEDGSGLWVYRLADTEVL